MPESPSATQHDLEQEYHAIEAALLETARGRWFLAEYSRRSRRLDDARLEDALEQLKSSLRDPPALLERVRIELDAVAQVLEDVRSAIHAQPAGTPGQTASGASFDLAAGASLLRAAEELHELIWSSRGQAASREVCEQIGRRATTMVALSVRQAEESEQARRFALAIDSVLRRVMAALESVQLEMGAASPGQGAELGSYAFTDLMPLDSILPQAPG